MKIRDAILAEQLPLQPIPPDLAYQFVVAGNGLYIRAEDSRIEAMVPVALGAVHGLEYVESYARLKVKKMASAILVAIKASAMRRLPNEAMYQLIWDADHWRCLATPGEATPASFQFEDHPSAVVDLHSHGNLSAFFSETDDRDEQGLRFYVVIGRVGDAAPQIACRVGVYGHHWNVPIETLFEGRHAFAEVDPEVEQVIAESDGDGETA